MKSKYKRVILLISIISLCLCACYGKNFFVHKLDKQFGKDTYTMNEEDKEHRYLVTLNDYPNHPFYVVSGIAGLPYEYSTFQDVFSDAIYDSYAKKEINNQSLYELTHDGYFQFELKHDMNPGEAERVYDEMEKILSVINDEYPIYNTQDYDIGVHRYTYEEGPLSNAYILASCENGSLQISSKEDFLAYRELMQEEIKYHNNEGVTIKNERSSSVTLGADTLRSLVLKGFHIDGFSGYSSLLDTIVASGDKGMSAWCDIGNLLDYKTIPLGAFPDKDTMSTKSNYIYVETSNTGSEACALKDTTVTKVIYHLNDVEKSTTLGARYLFLDDRCGDVTRGDSGFDLSTRWEIGQPTTEEEEQNGIRYKDVLVKIQSKLCHQGILEKLTDAPRDVKQMDITLTWIDD